MMSRVLKIVLKVLGWAVAGILAVALGLVAVCVWLHATADLNEPDFVPSEKCAVKLSDSLRVYGGNTLRLNADGLWVMSVTGSAFERGEAIGKLAEDLLYMQEKAFADKLTRWCRVGATVIFFIISSRFSIDVWAGACRWNTGGKSRRCRCRARMSWMISGILTRGRCSIILHMI